VDAGMPERPNVLLGDHGLELRECGGDLLIRLCCLWLGIAELRAELAWDFELGHCRLMKLLAKLRVSSFGCGEPQGDSAVGGGVQIYTCMCMSRTQPHIKCELSWTWLRVSTK
jgi:hypothetical protein